LPIVTFWVIQKYSAIKFFVTLLSAAAHCDSDKNKNTQVVPVVSNSSLISLKFGDGQGMGLFIVHADGMVHKNPVISTRCCSVS